MPTQNLAANNLAQLKDIHLPEPLSMWPPAPGWFLLAALIICSLFLIYFLVTHFWKKQAAKRAALSHLTNLERRYQQSKDATVVLPELSILLRRLALAYFPRQDAAGLYGDAWLEFLNKTGNTNAFTKELANLLTYSAYQKDVTADLAGAFVICKKWIKAVRCHSREGGNPEN